ncbi:MAG TPA: hypothetical protein VF210_12965 [Pseudomonadales bacterium]
MAAMIVLLVLMVMASAAAAAESERLPPELPPVPRFPPPEPSSIFTYSVDGACEVTEIRKLQGSNEVSARDVEKRVFGEDTVWRFVDGERLQLQERRVKLLGEMILEGELVCLVRPTGAVVEAWIERSTDADGRRRRPTREPVEIAGGAIEHLGTFSIEFPGAVH